MQQSKPPLLLTTILHPARILSLLLALSLFPVVVTAQNTTLTPEQIAQLQALSPEQREALLNSAGVSQVSTAAQVPVTNPVTVVPRDVSIPNQEEVVAVETLVEPTALTHFGYELFAGIPTTFAPATNIPVPANYVMGPGDTVVIQLYGQRNLTYELEITREGMLMFPEIGRHRFELW